MAGATKKREARKSVQQSGWITLDGGFAARPCVVQDMSANGAKITARHDANRGARIVLYSHGNAEDLGDLDPLLAPLRALGLDVVAYDYQGYGTSEGTPTEAHLQHEVDDNLARGMNKEEAVRGARVKLGSVRRVRETARRPSGIRDIRRGRRG